MPASELKFIHKDGDQTVDMTEQVMNAIESAMPGLSTKLLASTHVLPTGGGGARAMCESMGVPFLGSIPMDPRLALAADKGASIHEMEGEAQQAIQTIIDALLAKLKA